ncbi:MAG: thioesterase family protein [Anaerolineae bacterium]|nr:thioesterase family protein [Anaerolineae bacterium]
MRKPYFWTMQVRTYETNRFGMVNNVSYLNFLEEAATQASAAAGYPMEWYWSQQCMWLIRKMTIRYERPAFYGDELEIETWVSDFQRVRSNRDYVIRRQGQRIVRARANWVFVNAETLRPQRLDSGFAVSFGQPDAALEHIPVHLRHPHIIDRPRMFITEHEVKSYEIDMVGHVNNSMYPRWTEHAALSALRQIGWSFERQQAELNAVFVMVGREIEYFQSVKEGDTVRIFTHLAEVTRARAAMVHEVRHAETNELLVQDYSVGALVNHATMRPVILPSSLLDGFTAQ